ncbi:MAG: 2-phospho-L-lactate guanylyltransferase [Candidatus Heimdallarchaeota archaeon LC_3]|nr:MAG: 2-phospho-L-lactate guanylyltransferase [Candidatus Heimdallarchaeota archaeon LC_3]
MKCIITEVRSLTLSSALIVFTKVPQKGKVKTRLNEFLNTEQIESLQIAMIKDCIESGLKAEYERIIFSITPEDAKEEFVEKINLKSNSSTKIEFITQKGETFDTRFHRSVKDGFGMKEINKLAIIGSDCPFINPVIHDDLLKHLDDPSNVVLGWSKDGGVYIVGLSKILGKNFNFQDKFSGGIESWLLIEEAEKNKLVVKDLPELTDIDTPEDLRHAYILCKNLKKAGLFYPKHTDEAFDNIGLYIEDQEDNRSRNIKVKK